MADNMGGISETWFVLPMEIKTLVTGSGSAQVTLKAGIAWRMIRPSRYGAIIKVEPQTSEAGTLYNVSATIQIPRQHLDASGQAFCEQMSRMGGVVKYKNFNGELFVVGSERFPLKCNFEISHPSSPGGFSGYKLTITGKQLTPQLQVME